MYKKILIATDGSKLSDKAIQQGLAMAKSLKAIVVATTVVVPWFPPAGPDVETEWTAETHHKASIDYAKSLVEGIGAKAKKIGVDCEKVYVTGALPAEGILKTAKNNHCDLIVMASHGRNGFERLLVGSETLTVLTHTKIPVLVCR